MVTANADIWGEAPANNIPNIPGTLNAAENSDPKIERLNRLREKFKNANAYELIDGIIKEFGVDKIALFSSFGSYSALLLDVVAKANANVPVLFLETGQHFIETLKYVDQIEQVTGLKNLKRLTPDQKILKNADPEDDLWSFNVDRCCWIRKVEPLERHMAEAKYEAVITGRRSYQTQERSHMQTIELDEQGVFKINPFAFWSKDEVKAEFEKRALPQHPLVSLGYKSIGCKPCTRPVKDGEDERAGRWAHLKNDDGSQKTECGIHLAKAETKNWEI